MEPVTLAPDLYVIVGVTGGVVLLLSILVGILLRWRWVTQHYRNSSRPPAAIVNQGNMQCGVNNFFTGQTNVGQCIEGNYFTSPHAALQQDNHLYQGLRQPYPHAGTLPPGVTMVPMVPMKGGYLTLPGNARRALPRTPSPQRYVTDQLPPLPTEKNTKGSIKKPKEDIDDTYLLPEQRAFQDYKTQLSEEAKNPNEEIYAFIPEDNSKDKNSDK